MTVDSKDLPTLTKGLVLQEDMAILNMNASNEPQNIWKFVEIHGEINKSTITEGDFNYWYDSVIETGQAD
jgi:hypothetical protein